MDIKDSIKEISEEVIELRRDFHKYPELGLQEYRTADIIEPNLSDFK